MFLLDSANTSAKKFGNVCAGIQSKGKANRQGVIGNGQSRPATNMVNNCITEKYHTPCFWWKNIWKRESPEND